MSDVNLTDIEREWLCTCDDHDMAPFEWCALRQREEAVERIVAAHVEAARAAALAPIQALGREGLGELLALVDDYDGCHQRARDLAAENALAVEEGREPDHSDHDIEDAEWWNRRADAVLALVAAAGVDAAPNETAEIAERSDPAWTFDLMVKDGSITREAADLALGRMRQRDAGVVVPDSVWRARHSPSALAAALDEVRAQALRDAAADLDDDRDDVKRFLLARAAVPSGHEQEGDHHG